jgi:hypothetical protein
MEEHTEITAEEKKTLEEIREMLPEHIRKAPEREQSEFLMHIIRQRRRQVIHLCLFPSVADPKFCQAEMHAIHDKYLAIVKEHYKPKHPHLLKLSGWEIDPVIAGSVPAGSPSLASHLKSFFFPDLYFSIQCINVYSARPLDCDGLYRARFLSEKTCRELIEEVAHFETWSLDRGLTVTRPNSMNNYGRTPLDYSL